MYKYNKNVNKKKTNRKQSGFSFFLIVFLLFFSITLFAAETYEKKDLAIFSFYSGIPNVPDAVVQGLENIIQATIHNLKRFNVYFYPDIYLDITYLPQFIEALKNYREENYDQGTSSEFGNLVVSYDNMKKFAGSFYIIIPNLSYFSEYSKTDDETGETTYYVEMKVSVKILNVETYQIVGDLFMEIEESSKEDITEAESDAISQVGATLEHDIKDIEDFALKSGVIKKEGRYVYIDLGANVGVQIGNEFLVIGKEKMNDKFFEKIVGLVRVTEVGKDISKALILIEDQPITEGDQLKEYNRWGFDGMVYGAVLLTGITGSTIYGGPEPFSVGDSSFLLGAGFSAQSYLNFNLFIDIGTEAYLTSPFVLNSYLGVGYSLFLGRLIPSVSADACYIMMRELSDTNYYGTSTFGLRAQFSIQYLLNYSSSFILTAGYMLSFEINSFTYHDEFGGTMDYSLTYPISFTGLYFRFVYNIRF